jgi:uncharacterized protein (DUF362 family)/ferredoxin
VTSSQVAIVRCEHYEPDLVYRAIRRGVDLLGGLDRYVISGDRILLKPNILAGDAPEKAVSTHPALLASCVRLLREGGARVAFGDSPGLQPAERAARDSGLLDGGLRSGATFDRFSTVRPVRNAQGSLVPSFPLAGAVHEADGVINLPKVKTHQLTRITGAVKNLFGCVPGRRKAAYHVQFQNITDFCTLLVELSLALHPRLHIADAIVAMEGNGPRSGNATRIGVLVMSEDPVALDATVCRMVAMEPGFVPTNVIGQQLGLGTYQAEQIELLGDPLERFVRHDFQMIRRPVYDNASYAYYGAIKSLVLPRPVVDGAKCERCGLCVKACPVPGKAIRFVNGPQEGPPVYDYGQCIRCYCCQELCSRRAISTQTPLLGRILRLA